MAEKSHRSVGHHKGCFNTIQSRNLMCGHYKTHHKTLNDIKAGKIKAGIDMARPKTFTMIGKDIKAGTRNRLRNKRVAGAPDWVKITQKGIKDLQKRKSCYPDYGKSEVPVAFRRQKGFVLDFGTLKKPNLSGVPQSARNRRNKSKVRAKTCKSARGQKKQVVLRDIAPTGVSTWDGGRPASRVLSPRLAKREQPTKCEPKNPATMVIQLPATATIQASDENVEPLSDAMKKASLEDTTAKKGEATETKDVTKASAKDESKTRARKNKTATSPRPHKKEICFGATTRRPDGPAFVETNVRKPKRRSNSKAAANVGKTITLDCLELSSSKRKSQRS